MESALKEVLQKAEVADPVEADGLRIFGLRSVGNDHLSYTTLDEAMGTDALEITEISEGGSVPTLKVTNKCEGRVLLVAGEHLIGAKQDRALNVTMMVDGKTGTPVPVSCVEQGRWGYHSRKFRSSGSRSHSKLLCCLMKDTFSGYRCEGRPSSRQAEVWREVDRKLHKMGSRSPSAALSQAYDDHEERLSDTVGRISIPKDCCGVVFAIGGRIAGVDWFDKPATLSKLFPKLIKAYAIDALEEPEPGTQIGREEIATWLHSAAEAKSERFKSPGLGEDVRFEGDDVVGACLVVDDCPVHMALFSEDETEREHRHQLENAAVEVPATAVPRVAATRRDGSSRWQDIAVITTSEDISQTVRCAINALQAYEVSLTADLRLATDDPLDLANDLGVPEHTADLVLTAAQEQLLVRSCAEQQESATLRVLVTDYGLGDGLFSHWHQPQKTAVVSLHGWEGISRCPAAAFVACELVLHGLRAFSRTYEPEHLLHSETRGCLFDLCENRSDIDAKLRMGNICPDCRAALTKPVINVEQLVSVLAVVRGLAIGE